ncbi:MAG: 30S ribosomal protein S16 [Eubacteriaceae bacterium]|jgi:small subunit ribosomal protein S16|nr:30S ribosomal protein S16 [Eubacteriaceae bacterium]MDD4507896.1 30S ribosomal protein S16 [Eubacteriaceae bacterium]
MAVKIRMKRMGKKKSPFYRLVVADIRAPRDGKFIEEVGYYNPCVEPPVINLNDEAIKGWIANGAKPSDTVKALLKKENIID